jgi:hypothetical protein
MHILACDHCGAPNAVRFYLVVDRRLDAAGSMSNIGEVVDLCAKCQASALQDALEKFGYREAKDWVGAWKTK